MKILISDINYRKAFDVYNILRRYFNPDDFIFTLNMLNKIKMPAYKSIYGKSIFKLNTDSYNNFNNDIQDIINKVSQEIIYIPVEELTTSFFLRFINKFQQHPFKFILPEYYLFEKVRDKEKFNILCRDYHFSAPEIYSKDDLDNSDIYPIIIKPKKGSGAQNIVYLQNKGDLKKIDGKDFNNYTIQECIENSHRVYGCFYFFTEGKCVGCYCHRRLRSFPKTGGVSVFSEIVKNDTLIEYGRQLLEKLNWNGFAMLEYLYDGKTNTYKIIEINPRLWGSVLLSEYCNTNFLINYVNACKKKKLKQCYIKSPSYIRWPFPYDILFFFQSKFKIKGFFNFENTCFINFTYSSFGRSLAFIFISIFNMENIKKVINKMGMQ